MINRHLLVSTRGSAVRLQVLMCSLTVEFTVEMKSSTGRFKESFPAPDTKSILSCGPKFEEADNEAAVSHCRTSHLTSNWDFLICIRNSQLLFAFFLTMQ